MQHRLVRISTIVLSLVLVIAGLLYFSVSPLQNSSAKSSSSKIHKKHHPSKHAPTAGKPKPTSTPVKLTPTPTSSSAPGSGGPFQLIFSDNFGGAQLDPQWITYNGPHGGGKSCYDPHELQLQGGLLHIMMEQKANACGLPYVTGGMGAMRLAQTYGKYEFRAKLPLGKGVGPYAILWDAKGGHGDVEVDLFESPPPTKDKVYFTNHGAGNASQIIGNFAATFHTFDYEWTPGKLDFQIDGVEQGVLTKNVPNFSMWFGIAVSSGDAFTGSPDGTTHLPVSLDVSSVKIYKYIG